MRISKRFHGGEEFIVSIWMLLKEKSHGTVSEPEKKKHDEREGVKLVFIDLFKILPVPSSSPFWSSYAQLGA